MSAKVGQIDVVIFDRVDRFSNCLQSAKLARATNLHTYKALLDVIDGRADANDIPQSRRVELKLLVAPAVSLTSKPKPTASVLVLLLFIVGTLAVTHLLEALRNRRQTQEFRNQLKPGPIDFELLEMTNA